MTKRIDSLFQRFAHRRFLRRWDWLADQASDLNLASLRVARSRARQLRRPLDRLVQIAENRLALPLIGSNSIQTPLGSDWSYRPEIWRGPVSPLGHSAVANKTLIGNEATVFHDCSISELTFRQMRNTREADTAPFGLRLDVFQFDGSFLSLVLDLPDSAVAGLKKRHLLRMHAIVEMEKPLEIFARLNIRHGPNTEQIVRELPLFEDEVMVEFDLAYTKMNEKRVDHVWIDLIFEGPEMNQITLHDVTFSRRPRADL
ncbi:MAG: DUF6478 family protein [Halocynthiibacter sp.]